MVKFYLIAFDCESTGLSIYNDQVVELGAIVNLWDSDQNSMETVGTFAEYARPTKTHMSTKAEEITGISMNFLKDKPTIGTVLDKFNTFINETCNIECVKRILVSYNGFSYDVPIIINELERIRSDSSLTYFRSLRIDHTLDMLHFCRSHLDTSKLVRKANGSCSYKLGDVYMAMCHTPLSNAHGALVDSKAVLEIMAVDDVQCKLSEFTDDIKDCDHCKNPMTLVRSILSKKQSNVKCKGRRALDMFVKYKQNKRKKSIL